METPTSLPPTTVFARTACCEVGVDPAVGNLPVLTFHWQGKTLAPLHRAPWVGDRSFPDDMPLLIASSLVILLARRLEKAMSNPPRRMDGARTAAGHWIAMMNQGCISRWIARSWVPN
jgi:hypothetical protein